MAVTTIQAPSRDLLRESSRRVVILFVASGASGLMLEVVWSRMLGWLLGATTWAVMTVLVAYMGGLGLGSLLWGRRVGRSARPLRLFGLMETAIGLYGLAVPILLEGLGRLFVAATRVVGEDSGGVVALRVAMAVLVLAPPTLLMGGTLPVLTRFAAIVAQPGRAAGALYAANTAGAVVGCALAGCVLIFRLGVVETNTLAALIDLGVGVLALAWDRRVAPAESVMIAAGTESAARGFERVALATATLSGFCGLAYEVLWTRALLAAVTDDTTYAFTLMLTAFLAGHALGAARAGRGVVATEDGRGTWWQLGSAQVLAALAAMASLPILVLIRDPISRASFTEGMNFWGARVPFHLVISLVVFAPSAYFLGASFALAARIYVGRGRPVGVTTGRLYGLNTLGAVLGAIVATAWLIPAFGTQRSILMLGNVQAVLGVVVLVLLGGGRATLPDRAYAAAAWAVGLALAWGLNTALPLSGIYARHEPGKLLALVEGRGAAVTVHHRVTGDRVISINGVNVAGTNPVLRATQKLQAHLPVCLHPAPRSVLQIGFGSGGTCYSVSLHPEIESIDVAELNPDVLDVAMRWFGDINHHVLNDPRVRVRIVDAKSYVVATDRTYDLILSDSTHPRFRGNAALYGRDYFAACSRRLRPGGLLSTWLPLYGMSVEDVRGILKSVRSVFPHVQVWYANSEPHENTIVVASSEPIRIDPEALAARLGASPVAADLAEVGITSTIQVLDFFLMGDRGVETFGRPGRLSTDDHPRLEFLAPRSLRRKQSWLENLAAILRDREPLDPYLLNADDTWRARLSRWYDGTTWKLAGQVHELEGDVIAALAAYRKGVRRNPEDLPARVRLERLRHALALQP
jgi:spermidine synthase